MNIKLLLQHGTSIYDATPILEGRVEWFASVMGKAGRLKFRVVRDGIVNFVEGDRVSFYVDSVLRFSGFVMTKERTSEQIISVTAYDQFVLPTHITLAHKIMQMNPFLHAQSIQEYHQMNHIQFFQVLFL